MLEQKRITPYLLLTPLLIYYALFWAGPLSHAIWQSFHRPDGSWTLEYFETIFNDEVFSFALVNTAVIVLVSVFIEFCIAMTLALLIQSRFKGSGIFFALAIIPMALPEVGIGAIWSSGLATNGWVNSLLTHLGVLGLEDRIHFLKGDRWPSIALIIFIDAWQVIPFMMIILLAGLQNLDPSHEEAAKISGAPSLQILFRITLPMMKSTIQTALILRIISAIQIWLIIVMLFGFRRVPVLLEEAVFYKEMFSGDDSYRISLAYSVLIAIIVGACALFYSWKSTKVAEQAS